MNLSVGKNNSVISTEFVFLVYKQNYGAGVGTHKSLLITVLPVC